MTSSIGPARQHNSRDELRYCIDDCSKLGFGFGYFFESLPYANDHVRGTNGIRHRLHGYDAQDLSALHFRSRASRRRSHEEGHPDEGFSLAAQFFISSAVLPVYSET
jgi:hypothetical protein